MLNFVPSEVSGMWTLSDSKWKLQKKYFASWKTIPWVFGFIQVWSTHMHSVHFHTFARWFFQFESYGPAILVTVGAALLMACGIGAACSPCEEKDEVFHRQVF